MKKRFLIPLSLLFLALVFFVWFYNRVIYSEPTHPEIEIDLAQLQQKDTNHWVYQNSWLRKNEFGNWECYVEGNGYERGLILGVLQQKLGETQEQVFVNEIDQKVPSWFFRKLLILGISWFNRDLDQYIPQEYREELYGISHYFSNQFDYIGPKYNRITNYHAAHDIGHAVQNMHMVACTAVGAWKFDSIQSSMIVGRNFDFYFGDDFAKQKVILFSRPTTGYANISVTWPSFIGVVSGLNETGLGITLNSAKSQIPTQAGTPVSIIAREVLQYASTIHEAVETCEKYSSFVSESFTISSLNDQKVAVIEITPTQVAVYYPATDTVVITNHFQSEELKNSAENLAHMESSETVPRFQRTQALLRQVDTVSENTILSILRDQKGPNSQEIGLGNPQAINQLLAHHSVIFNNTKKQLYVSTFPFQLGPFTGYSVRDIARFKASEVQFPIFYDSLRLSADTFLTSTAYADFLEYKKSKSTILQAVKSKQSLDMAFLQEWVNFNPNYYETYMVLGKYYHAVQENTQAIKAYQEALNKVIPYKEDAVFIQAQVDVLKKEEAQ